MNPKYAKLNFLVQDLLKRWNTENHAVIRRVIARSLKNTSRTIVFVGKDTYKSLWIPEEIKITLDAGKSVYAIRLKDTHGVKPACLSENKIHLYPWHEENLQYLATRED